MKKPILFVLGDSISIHYGPFLKEMVADKLTFVRNPGEEEALRDLDTPTGSNGGDSSRVLSYLQGLQAQGYHPDFLLLNCGLHDMKTDPHSGAKQVPLAQYRENLTSIVSLVATMGTRLIWVRTTPVDDEQHNSRSKEFYRYAVDVTAYNAVADEIMTAAGVPMIDLFAFTRSLGDGVFCDHVHYVEPVRKLQAAFIAGQLYALSAWQPVK